MSGEKTQTMHCSRICMSYLITLPTTSPHKPTTGIYHIAGNFRGRKLSRIGENTIFAEKTFADCSLLQRQRTPPPKFRGEKYTHKTAKFAPSKVFRGTCRRARRGSAKSLVWERDYCEIKDKIWKWAGNEASVSLVRRSTWSYMAKGRLRARVRRPKPSKANRWRKGHSSSSNPVANKHRLSARGKFASHLAQTHGTVPGPTLTTEALTTHDANQEDGSALDR